jgi:arylsulfatase A-like enzyme
LGDGKLDWNGEIKPGPLEIGFDYCFLLPATGDRVPCVYVENHSVVGLEPDDPIQVRYDAPVGNEPTGKENPGLLKQHPSHGHDMTIVNGISRIGYMSGGKAARWVDEEMADTLTEKAVAFIERSHDGPFFLFFATHDIHVPRVPHPRFAGRSGMGPRGDAILQLDWCVGKITETLDRFGIADDTLVIFTSDNGPVVDDGYRDEAIGKLGAHRPAGPLRGGKYSAFEGGTRVPFIARWPGRIAAGESDALVCQIDFLRSLAALVEVPLAHSDAPDSENLLDALTGKSQEGRKQLVEHSRTLAFRQGQWKYIESAQGPALAKAVNIKTGLSPEPALYDLANDLGERNNLAEDQPERVAEMAAELARIRQASGKQGGAR